MAGQILTRSDLRNHLRKREIVPVYLLFGDETYLRNLAASTIAEMVMKGAALREFNESEISLATSDIRSVVAAAEQIPMMDARRVVKVSDVAVSSSKNKDTIKEDEEVFLKDYLANPSESTVLILVAEELDKRRKISKLLLANSVAVEFKPLNDREMVAWAKDKLRDLGAKADEKSLWHLVSLVGNDVRKLTLELEKLATAALPDTVISDRLIDALAPNTRDQDNFELTNHLLSRNRREALRVTKKILDDGAEPLMLLGLLSFNFHGLFLAKEMMDEGCDEKAVSGVVRLPWDRKKAFLETARRTERSKLSWIIKRLADTDLAIKTSIGTPRLQIEILICELIAA